MACIRKQENGETNHKANLINDIRNLCIIQGVDVRVYHPLKDMDVYKLQTLFDSLYDDVHRKDDDFDYDYE